jgi:hypothetical protein
VIDQAKLKGQMRLAVRIALDMAQASRGLWVSQDLVGVGQYIPTIEQITMEKVAGANKFTARHLRELAIKAIGLPFVLPTIGLSVRQLDALQISYERDSDAMTRLLERAMYQRGRCVLEGVEFDFTLAS